MRYIVEEEKGPVCHCTPDWNIIDTHKENDNIAAAWSEELANEIVFALNNLEYNK